MYNRKSKHVDSIFCFSRQVTGNQGTLVHYAQQQARREAESTAIRRQKNDLEVALRDAEIRYIRTLPKSFHVRNRNRKL